MNKYVTLSIFTVLAQFSSDAIAQNCYGLTATTPTSQFTLSGNLVTDNKTQLVWMRCAYGQTWNADSSACTGNAVRVDWQQALQLASQQTSTDLNEWRLPNVKELSTIVEKQCVDPAINSTLFPNAPAEDFWTATTSADTNSYAWAVTFYNGRNNQQGKNVDKYFRLVKFAEQ